MGLIVQKFGGTSVANAERLRNVAQIIADTYRQGNRVVAVLSAQGDTTDDLIEKAREINPNASRREMDMLLSTGEQISCALCAMAIETMGLPVVSLTGWQAGIQTNSSYSSARIKKINVERVQSELDRSHSIVIVTGFQGINKYGDVTTLGRGGSDTSAVALAAALKADLCQIYTDVDGIYTADPRHVTGARKFSRSPSIEHHISRGIPFDQNGVKDIVHTGQGILQTDKMGLHIGTDGTILPGNGPAQKFNPPLAGICIGLVSQGNAGNTCGRHLFRQQVPAKSDGR